MKISCTALLVFLAFSAALAAQESIVLADFESGADGIRLRESNNATGAVKYELQAAPDGNTSLALKFERVPNAGFAYVYLPFTKALAADAANFDGLSLAVKGDGSKTFGLIEIRTDQYVNIFQAVVPLTSTDWSTVTIRWDEFFQINDGTRQASINWKDLNVFAFGSRTRWGSCAFEVDDMKLARIPERPEPPKAPPGMRSLAPTREKLAAGGDFTLVALGDSITVGVKVPSNKRATDVYSARVARGLEEAFPAANVRHVNRGVGGNTIAEGLIRIGHEVAPENPDLVLVLLGANDAIYEFTDPRVRHTMATLLDRLIETTDADILLLGPTQITNKPGIPERYATVYEELARQKGVAYFNLAPSLSVLARDDYKRALADTVHLSQYGHQVIAKAVLERILQPPQ